MLGGWRGSYLRSKLLDLVTIRIRISNILNVLGKYFSFLFCMCFGIDSFQYDIDLETLCRAIVSGSLHFVGTMAKNFDLLFLSKLIFFPQKQA